MNEMYPFEGLAYNTTQIHYKQNHHDISIFLDSV